MSSSLKALSSPLVLEPALPVARSLADFAKMVEVFDAQGVSFVAVTQQFNTTTSMVQRSVGGSGAVDRRDRQARTSCGPLRAMRDAAGVSRAQDRRGNRRRPPAYRPNHPRNDPENRTAPALERAGASARHPIDLGVGVPFVRRSSQVRTGFTQDIGRVADGTT
jgi:hypothetical protein